MCALKKGRLTCSTMDFSSPTIKRGDTWVPKKWNMPEGMDYPTGIWTDGTNIYCSSHMTMGGFEGQFVLNGDTWEPKVWNGLTEFPSYYIWTDGVNIYYSYNDSFKSAPVGNYVLNGDTWEPKIWNNEPMYWNASDLWTDGTNIYLSCSWGVYVLNGDTWEPKTWSGNINMHPAYIWSDGVNIYHSSVLHYVLNGDTWEPKTFANSLETYFDGQNIWTDGVNVYYGTGDECYVLNGDTWEPKVWKGANAGGSGVWTDGTNIYYKNYVLTTSAPPEPPDPTALLMGYRVGCALRAMRGKQ